jgi:DNA adenine methylase
MNAPTRPVLRWHGGKWKLAPWIISRFPKHRVYVEPFGGAASVLLRKERSYAEVYNDLDQDVVTLFRVLRDANAGAALLAALKLTPFAKMEFEESYRPAADQVEVARRLLIRSFMGFGSNGHNAATKTGFRANSNRSGTTPARDWANYPDLLPTIIERLTGVVIETRDACEVMSAHDGAQTLHYVDPPYMFETRSKAMHRNGCYAHEMDRGGHVSLLKHLRTLEGMIVLSGYPDELYDTSLADWRRVQIAAHADGARDRVEVLWLNPACAASLDRERSDLFSGSLA